MRVWKFLVIQPRLIVRVSKMVLFSVCTQSVVNYE